MKDLKDVKHIHMIAICGTAMGALAGMLVKSGYKVTGSDEGVYPPMSDYLAGLGIEIMSGFKPENLNVNPDFVIVGNTVKAINPEAQELIRREIPYMHLPAAISEYFIKGNHSIVISGTHGKTTTTSLTTWLFESAGKDPGFLVGGIMKNFNANSKLGSGGYFVIEGDEYDSAYFDKVPKMWHYRPQTAVITNVEFDHGDIYRDIDHVKDAFKKFVSLIPKDGLIIACADYPNVPDVIKDAECKVVTYGYSENADIRVENLSLTEQGAEFDFIENGKKIYTFKIPLWGRHNATNAAAAAKVAMHHGISCEEIQRGFDTFEGIKRRQEIIYSKNDIIIIDDFAHHPTKARETVKAVRSRYPSRRLISIFEPRTNTTRRNFFQNEYPDSFTGSDHVVIAGVFNLHQIEEGRAFNPEKLVEDINRKGIEAHYILTPDDITDRIKNIVKPGDVILIMSNGGFGGIYEKLPRAIDEKFPASPCSCANMMVAAESAVLNK